MWSEPLQRLHTKCATASPRRPRKKTLRLLLLPSQGTRSCVSLREGAAARACVKCFRLAGVGGQKDSILHRRVHRLAREPKQGRRRGGRRLPGPSLTKYAGKKKFKNHSCDLLTVPPTGLEENYRSFTCPPHTHMRPTNEPLTTAELHARMSRLQQTSAKSKNTRR